MADGVYEVDLNVSRIRAVCSCGRLTLTFYSEPSADDTAELRDAIERHKAQYPGETHTFTLDMDATIAQADTKEAH